MEDYLITLTGSFVDTETGEVLSNFQFSKPLSLFHDCYQKYFDCFERGVRQGRKVTLHIDVINDRELPKVKQTTIF